MSYVIAPSLMDEFGRKFYELFTQLAASVGEPLLWTITPDEAEALVRRCGLDVADHPTRDDLQARYFAGRADDLAPITMEQPLTAAVPG